jgi:hypothetical protein
MESPCKCHLVSKKKIKKIKPGIAYSKCKKPIFGFNEFKELKRSFPLIPKIPLNPKWIFQLLVKCCDLILNFI